MLTVSSFFLRENKMSDRAELLLELKRRVGCCINAAEAKLHTLSKDIWSCPELAYEETKAHDRLVTFFSQEECWTVDSHFKLETAFRATWGAGGRDVVSVCFLCDSLPDIRHACGHNLIAEVGAAAAVGLKAVLEDIQELAAQVQVCPAAVEGETAVYCLSKMNMVANKTELHIHGTPKHHTLYYMVL